MQSVNELWRTLRAMPGTEVEYRFDINGVTYGREAEVSHEVNHALYTEFGFGNASCGGLTLQLYADTIPKSAKIQRYCRLVNGEQSTDWLPAGVYYTSHRAEEDGFWDIEAFDDMRKAEKVWEPDQTLEFPMPMDEAVAEICRVLGFTLDARSEISHTYNLDYPQSEQTFRQTMKWIAAAHGGNWIFTPAGELRLVPALSATGETHYLVDEYRKPITFGGTSIWVGEIEERDRHFIGLDLFSNRNNGKRKPVSRVTLMADDEHAYTAGDDTGLELVADCPYATQDMVEALLEKLAGYEYQAYSADGANLDPAAELGDGISVDGAFFVLASIREDGSGYPDIAAPGDVEREEEYPEGNYFEQAFNRKLAQTRSLISKTIDSITLSVTNEEGEVSIQLKAGDKELGEPGTISLKGLVTFEALADEPTGKTTIHGGWIDADTLNVDAANISGPLNARKVSLYGDMTVYADADGETIGGKIGYTTSLLNDGSGIHVCSAGGNAEVALTDSGARLQFINEIDGDEITELNQMWVSSESAGISVANVNYLQVYGDTEIVVLKGKKWDFSQVDEVIGVSASSTVAVFQ